MDPLLAGLVGAALASGVWAVVLTIVLRHRGAGQSDVDGSPEKDDTTSAAADLVPLVFAPVNALREVVGAALPELRSFMAPGGNVAIVFSDIADSTKLNRRLGDQRWADLLRAHDEVVRGVVRDHGGRVVKRQGDGFMAAFHDAPSAVHAALRLQDAVTSVARRPRLGLGRRVVLDLRVGVHVGEVVSQRGDYFGTNVVLAARVAATARPGTVLVTDAVAQAVAGTEGSSGADGVELHPLGKLVTLRGLQGRHRLHRAVQPM